ncbi:hypothetical protein FE783_27590 [Paenibacillus mesophilus]|uniref:hypothetical protein n=1 Tax=Paenibacillus mesophilus TaxID=2582849 RepID=UPI00110F58D7|nr:hypothetical protein [Paenibacillus mesophilus]TMV45908.1 hypothetical protein FE783_27590 [Paenibacillus mesophilus]
MSNWHRILWIDKQIRESKYPNCTRIAERFNISVRQASRDVEYLRDSLEAPVDYCPVKRGYRYSNAAFRLPAVTVTGPEKQALSLLADKARTLDGDGELGLSGLFDKLERLSADERPGRVSWSSKKEPKEAEERLAAAINAAMTSPHTPRTEPFYADVRFDPPEIVEALRLDAEYRGNSVFRVRYYSVELFMRLLLSIPYEFRIVSPSWLRNMMRHRLEKKLRGLSW